jgi:hypothetical protein
MPRLFPLALLLAACAATAPAPKTHTIHRGKRLPPLEEMAVLLVLSPPDENGKTLVGRITREGGGADYRPPLDTRLIELEPDRYRLETYFWIARSRLEGEKLLIENLQSARIAPVEIVVEAGRTYFIRAELRRREEVPAEEMSGFHPLNYAASLADPEGLRRGDSEFTAASDYVWRPHLSVLPPARAKEYRSHR